ncbi:unnamed protein product, partial [Mesorhabditis spiculigera]
MSGIHLRQPFASKTPKNAMKLFYIIVLLAVTFEFCAAEEAVPASENPPKTDTKDEAAPVADAVNSLGTEKTSADAGPAIEADSSAKESETKVDDQEDKLSTPAVEITTQENLSDEESSETVESEQSEGSEEVASESIEEKDSEEKGDSTLEEEEYEAEADRESEESEDYSSSQRLWRDGQLNIKISPVITVLGALILAMPVAFLIVFLYRLFARRNQVQYVRNLDYQP